MATSFVILWGHWNMKNAHRCNRLFCELSTVCDRYMDCMWLAENFHPTHTHPYVSQATRYLYNTEGYSNKSFVLLQDSETMDATR